jgi:hypothetical protein
MKLNFVDYFKKNKKEIQENKLVLILGSGFHKQAFDCEQNVLSSWTYLLKKLGSKQKLQSSIVEFEQIVIKETYLNSEKQASKKEIDLLTKASDLIKIEQSKAIKNQSIKYPIEIFNPNYVSDVINLNFDLIAETILSPNQKFKKRKDSEYLSMEAFHEVNGINFWHPHGEILAPKHICMGLSDYGKRIKKIEKLREKFKENERLKKESVDWVSKLIIHPVLIIGADLSQNEWDIWYALISRQRNFARNKNLENPVFKMKGNCIKSDSDILFHGISDKVLSYDEEWRILSKLFSK